MDWQRNPLRPVPPRLVPVNIYLENMTFQKIILIFKVQLFRPPPSGPFPAHTLP